MTVYKSELVDAYESDRARPMDKSRYGGHLLASTAVAEIAANFGGATAGADNGDVVLMIPVHSSDVPADITLINDSLGSSARIDIGIYETPDNGGAKVNDELFATNELVTSARNSWKSVLHEELDIDHIGKQLWQFLNLDEDPGKSYMLGINRGSTGTIEDGGTVGLRYLYLRRDGN